jgi:hypothetical protein
MSTKFPENPTPAELRRAYAGGFTGSKCDPDGLALLLGDLIHPLFGAAAYPLAGDGKGKVSLPFKSLLKFDAGFGPAESQTTGDCVSHSTRNAVDITRAVEIDVKGEEEGFLHRGATEAIYGCRGHGGQGMSCSQAARFVSEEGGILLRKDYGFIDLSVYDGSLGASWGRKGVPDSVEKEGRRHGVNTVSLVVSVEEARDALSNGYALSVCSGVGFSSRRDENGYANRKGSWSHAMAWIGCNDTKKHGGPGFLVQNSWGKWNGGGKKFEQPDGSFWINYDVAASMLSARGAWVFSDVNGFPPRKLPDYGKSLWG